MKRLAFLLLAVALIAIFVRAGFWQLGRAEDKQQLMAHVANTVQVRQSKPLSVLISASEIDKLAGRSSSVLLLPEWTRVSGRFLPEQVLLDNQRRDQQVGVLVYQRFQPDDATPTIFIELGWLPISPDRRLPTPLPMQGEHEFNGLWLAAPSPGLAIGAALQPQASGQLLALRFDRDALAKRYANTFTHAVVRPDPNWPHGYARDLNALVNTLTPEKHRGYAVQWFGLAITLTVIVLIRLIRSHLNKDHP